MDLTIGFDTILLFVIMCFLYAALAHLRDINNKLDLLSPIDIKLDKLYLDR